MIARHPLLLVTAVGLILATAARLSAEGSPTDNVSGAWRSLLASDYRYTPRPAPPQPASDRPSWMLAQAPAPADPAIVRLAPVEVRAHPIYGELHQAFGAQAAAAKQQYVIDRLGIGFEGFHSKHAAIGVVTVFHIPVLILGVLSW